MALARAKLFVQEGAHVFITGRHEEALDAARRDGRVLADSAGLDRTFETVRQGTGSIDVRSTLCRPRAEHDHKPTLMRSRQ